MGNAINVRRIDWSNSNDIGGYVAVLDSYARDPMGRNEGLTDEVRQRLPAGLANHPAAQVLLAIDGSSVVGIATCFLGYSTFQARPLLNLHDIAVLPSARGLGIGRQLLEGVEDLARELGCCRVTLEVRSDNPLAIRLYESHGYCPGACDRFMDKSI